MNLNFKVIDQAGQAVQECLIHRAWAVDILQPLIGQYGVLGNCPTGVEVRRLHAIVDNGWQDRSPIQIEFDVRQQAMLYQALAMQVTIFATQARNSIGKVLAEISTTETNIVSNALNNAHRRLGYTADLIRLLVMSLQGNLRFAVESVREKPKQ